MNNKIDQHHPDEINIKELISALLNKKLFIISITSFFAIFSVIFSLLLPNIYSSSALLAPSKNDESLTSQLGQYSSMAALAGISLPSSSGNSRTGEAVERIKSYEFFSLYFLPNVSFENIMAVKKWDPENNKIIYKNNFYDSDKKTWLKEIPSNQLAFKAYKKALNVNVDKITSFVSISIEHKSPLIAKKWLDLIIYNINESMRQEDIKLSQNYIKFLNNSQKSTNIQSLKEVAARLLESQMQTLMLASSSESYIFKTIDSPIIPEEKIKPSRAIICIALTIFGAMLSIVTVLIRYYFSAEFKT